ncbi:MAG TPA: LON peptidase substrate-binding domain-containing protein, partial [Prolixibacteraceae bacterium]|nr:LON peptidase substrate-binding domain-containing protein [Prolixibacteraceae bacterium]
MGEAKNIGFQNIIVTGMMENESDFIPIIADGDDRELKNTDVPDVLPILPLRNTVLFPGVVLPITVGRKKSLKLIQDVNKGSKLLGTIAQKDYTVDDPELKDFYRVGTVAEILKILEMPDGSTSVIIQGRRRYQIKEFIAEDPYFKAAIEPLNDMPPENNAKFNAIVGSLKDLSIKIAQFSANVPPEATFAVKNIENSTFLINFICSNTDLNVENKQQLLEVESIKDRGIQAISYLVKEVQMLELKQDIQKKVKTDMDKQQREFMLNQQMKTIQDELGGNPVEQEIKDLKEKAKDKKWDEDVAKFFEKEVD